MGQQALENIQAVKALSVGGKSAIDLMERRDALLSVGKFFVESGLMPSQVNTPSKAALIIWKGHELGLSPVQAISGINVISGKPTISPQLMLNLILQSGQAEKFEFVETNDERCTIHAKRRNGWEITETFSIEDAKRIKTKEGDKVIPLSEKSNYRSQPRVMLRWRCVSAVSRLIFSDIVEGCYLAEELEDSAHGAIELDATTDVETAPDQKTAATVAQDGPVIDAQVEPVASAEPQAPAPEKSETKPAQAEGQNIKRISAPQAKAILKAIKEKQYDEAELLKKHGITCVEELPASEFQATLKAINETVVTEQKAAEPTKAVISADQVEELKGIINKIPDYKTDQLLGYFHITKLEDLPADNYTFVVQTLRAKLAA